MYRWETSGLENTALWSERHELEQNKRKKISLQHGQSNSPTPKSTLAQKYVPEKIQSMLTNCFEIGQAHYRQHFSLKHESKVFVRIFGIEQI